MNESQQRALVASRQRRTAPDVTASRRDASTWGADDSKLPRDHEDQKCGSGGEDSGPSTRCNVASDLAERDEAFTDLPCRLFPNRRSARRRSATRHTSCPPVTSC